MINQLDSWAIQAPPPCQGTSLRLHLQGPFPQVPAVGCGLCWGAVVQPATIRRKVVKTYFSPGLTQQWAPQNPEEAAVKSTEAGAGGVRGDRPRCTVMGILCRRSLADKGAGTRKGRACGGNRTTSGCSWVWFTPGRPGEGRAGAHGGVSWLEGGCGDGTTSGWQGRGRSGGTEAGKQWSPCYLLAVRMRPIAGEDGKACARGTRRARTDGARVARGQ